jgi:outer membrane usher protein
VQFSRDFAVRPDLVTYPLPQFAGEAAVPSSVDLFINGYKSDSALLQPGPYTLTNVPFINGAGEAVVVTTDALGRQVSTTVPFYVTSTLLQKGLTDFSVAAGSLRREYTLKDFAYGPGVASGTFRYGYSDNLTLESHAEASSDLTLGGLGGNLRLGNFGVLNTAVSQSQFEGRGGQQMSLGYQYNSMRYTRDLPGEANMTLACNAVGQQYDCLSLTLEMPFKDNDDAPNLLTGWSGKRSMQLGKDVLSSVADIVDVLR